MEHRGPGKPPVPITRMEAKKAANEDIPLPPNPAPYLIDWLLEIGPTQPVGMGAAPISFGAMLDWQDIMGVELQPWEARMLRRLSVDYVNEQYHARDKDRLAPYSAFFAGDVRANRQRVDDKIRSLFGGPKKKD